MRGAASHRGFGFLEVVLSIAILSAVIVTMVGGYGSIRTMVQRDQMRLEATEVAHRLILIYTYISPDDLPGPGEPIAQGERLYSYRLREDILVEEGSGDGSMSRRGAQPASSLSSNQKLQSGLVLVSIDVYPHVEGGAPGGEPIASLSRIFDATDPTALSEDAFLGHIMRLLGSQSPLEPGGAGQ